MNRQQGLSLVELLVATAVGLVLMTGVMQVFLSSKQVYSSQDSLSRSQETGRLANEFLTRNIRMAGYVGCVSGNIGEVTNTLNSSGNFLYRFGTAVEGFDFGTTNDSGIASLPADVTLSPAPRTNTDILVIRGAFDGGIQVENDNNSAQLFVEHQSTDTNACPGSTTGYSGLCQKDILIVSDCSKARIFQATNLQLAGGQLNVVHSNTAMTPGNAISSWGGSSAPDEERFGEDAEIIKMSTVVYYIAVSNATGRSGLWQKTNGADAVELLEGVEDMQVRYGRDTDANGIPDAYQTATTINAAGANAWEDVQSVRVQLLVQSLDNNVVPDPQPYTFNGATVTPTDHRLRHVFTATTAIRGRLK